MAKNLKEKIFSNACADMWMNDCHEVMRRDGTLETYLKDLYNWASEAEGFFKKFEGQSEVERLESVDLG